MLKIILGLVLLLIIALLGHRVSFTRLRLPAGARLIFLTGTEFILVGLALGDNFLGLLDAATVRGLAPVLTLGLGFIGLLFGIQIELGALRRFPSSHLRITLLQSLVTIAVVYGPAYLGLRALSGDAPGVELTALVLAAIAGCTAQTALALLAAEHRLQRAPLMELLRYISSLDAAVGLTVLGLAFGLMHTTSPVGLAVLPGLQWFLLSLVLGVVLGWLLELLTRTHCKNEELPVFVLGLVLFGSGVAQYLRLSPLFVCMVMGLYVANRPGAKDRIFKLLVRLERPMYIVFLVLAGAVWRPDSLLDGLVLAGGYLVARATGKLLGGYLAGRTAPAPRPPAALGLGLTTQGGVAVAMALSYFQLGPSALADLVITAVLVAVLLAELISPSLTRVLLRRAGELTP